MRTICVPYFKQEKKDTCGAAVLRMALGAFGIQKNESYLAKLLKINKISGVRVEAFPQALEKFKLNYTVGRNGTLSDLKPYIKSRHVVIVGYFEPEEKMGHFAVIGKIGGSYVELLDPHPDFGPKHRYKRAKFIKLWKKGFRYDKDSSWFVAIKR